MSLPSLDACPASEIADLRFAFDVGPGRFCCGLIQDEGFADIDTARAVLAVPLARRSRPAAAVWRRRARHCRSRRAALLRPRWPAGTRGT